MTRKRFDANCLERYEFVDLIVQYLKQTCELRLEFSRVSNHLKFSKGRVLEKRKHSSIAIVGYGGSGKDIRALPTPLQTELLPLVFAHWDRVSKGDKTVPLLILGHSFDEVFLRKINLLGVAIPDIRLIQYINVVRFDSLEERASRLDAHYQDLLGGNGKIKNEVYDFQSAVVEYLKSGGEMGGQQYYVLDCEVPAGEGTVKSEMIDILALERKRKWLTAIELKYEKLTSSRTQSVIFQGLDYCNWVENHKRGLAMLFPEYKIDTRRRTRLILANGPEGFPAFHRDFVEACAARDRYQEIELYTTNNQLPLNFKQFG